MRLLKQKYIIIFFSLFFLVLFLLPKNAFAKDITLSSPDIDLEVGKTTEIQIMINTDAPVGALGFNVDFSTENLEGLTPNQNGSVFPMCAKLSSTRLDLGMPGMSGFTGEGLITTLVFKGRLAGTTIISLDKFDARFNGNAVEGFSSNSISLTVWGVGLKPVKKVSPTPTPAPTQSNTGGGSEDPAPVPLSNGGSIPQAQLPQPGASVTGSTPQVPGKIGSQPEDPLKAGAGDEVPSIKGLFQKNNRIYLSFFPTMLLLALAVFLGTRLYFTEKKRHIEMERLFDKQLGMLSALESKVDLVSEKGGGGKEKFLAEFEQARSAVKAIEAPEETTPAQPNPQT